MANRLQHCVRFGQPLGIELSTSQTQDMHVNRLAVERWSLQFSKNVCYKFLLKTRFYKILHGKCVNAHYNLALWGVCFTWPFLCNWKSGSYYENLNLNQDPIAKPESWTLSVKSAHWQFKHWNEILKAGLHNLTWVSYDLKEIKLYSTLIVNDVATEPCNRGKW